MTLKQLTSLIFLASFFGGLAACIGALYHGYPLLDPFLVMIMGGIGLLSIHTQS